MGGNVFKSLNSVRLDKKEFQIVSANCLSRLQSEIPVNNHRIIISYQNKPSYGDLDILWCGPDKNYEKMGKVINALQDYRNGPVVSFAIPISHEKETIFQVDLINVDPEHFESAFCYFAYNDLGNLIGRIFHRAGFKLGHKGVTYLVREEGNNSHCIGEIEVTRSWKEALSFAGYDYNRWEEGFKELEDVFEFAASSPLANQAIFRLDQTNHAARVRDRKRLTYQKFLLWVKDPQNRVAESESVPKDKLRSEWIEKALSEFPLFKENCNKLMEDICLLRESKRKFSGSIVREITGLNGKELGEFMKSFSENYKEEGVVKWTLSKSESEIRELINNWLKEQVVKESLLLKTKRGAFVVKINSNGRICQSNISTLLGMPSRKLWEWARLHFAKVYNLDYPPSCIEG